MKQGESLPFFGKEAGAWNIVEINVAVESAF